MTVRLGIGARVRADFGWVDLEGGDGEAGGVGGHGVAAGAAAATSMPDGRRRGGGGRSSAMVREVSLEGSGD